MIWIIVLCYAFFMVYKARSSEMFIKQNPAHPYVPRAKVMIGWYYFSAMIVMGAYPYALTSYTTNLITHLVIIIPVVLVGIAAWWEWNKDIDKSNQWIKRAYFALCIGVILSAFVVPAEDYNFPGEPIGSISESNK